MNLFKKAFGNEFEPQIDDDSAIKFVLNVLMMDKDMSRLIELLDVTQEIGCIEGDPGWELERIEDNDRGLSGYSAWPQWADFRAYIDPEFYELRVPEVYYTSDRFKKFVNQAIEAYLSENPEEKVMLEKLVKLIERL